MCTNRQAGVTLVELVIFIIIVSFAVAGILAVMNMTIRHSSDPLIRKQAIAVAESLMEEIALHAFTFCDPGDANLTIAADNNGCAVAANNQSTLTPQAGETRYSSTNPFDNVADYNGFTMTGITGIDGSAIVDLANYNASVAITNAGAAFGLGATEVLQIIVTVVNGAESVSLTSFRFRYAPRDAP
jgi:MSHA pilin protein MshD